jgi:hypothetical protein
MRIQKKEENFRSINIVMKFRVPIARNIDNDMVPFVGRNNVLIDRQNINKLVELFWSESFDFQHGNHIVI